jgi:hypothetical protein
MYRRQIEEMNGLLSDKLSARRNTYNQLAIIPISGNDVSRMSMLPDKDPDHLDPISDASTIKGFKKFNAKLVQY